MARTVVDAYGLVVFQKHTAREERVCTESVFPFVETSDSSGFVLLADSVPHVVQEIRYYSTYNFVGERVDGYEEPVALLTKEAARALKAVSSELIVRGYRLKVFDAYRPVCAVRHFILWGKEDQDMRMKPYFYPDLEKQELFSKGYIARRSSHSRGSAVDLTLLDMASGRELDMGISFDSNNSFADHVQRNTATGSSSFASLIASHMNDLDQHIADLNVLVILYEDR
ncbi:MAG: M15 family metallopeptidase [Clostridia bacterium]|nr:M15 family metallopeptidase [Clostridia bacterium]